MLAWEMSAIVRSSLCPPEVAQLCLTLCDGMDCSLPGSSLHGILQARTLEWVCHFLLQCMKVKSESEVSQSCPTLSDPMASSLPGSSIHGFPRQEYWSGVPLPSPVKDFGIVNKAEVDVLWHSLAFLMIEQMLAI